MPREQQPDPVQYIDDTHRAIAEFADAYLDEDERSDFVDSLLERHGYERMTAWAPPQPQGGPGGGRGPLVRPAGQRPRSGGQGAGGGQGGGQGGGYFRGARRQ